MQRKIRQRDPLRLFTLDLPLPSSHRVHGASSFLRWVDVHLTQPNSTTGGLSVNFQLSLAYPPVAASRQLEIAERNEPAAFLLFVFTHRYPPLLSRP